MIRRAAERSGASVTGMAGSPVGLPVGALVGQRQARSPLGAAPDAAAVSPAPDPIGDLSIIIPTLNAAARLPETLAGIAGTVEVVVADGGSNDQTRSVASAHGARVVVAPAGRGLQLAAGIDASSRPWLLLLHADTVLSPAWRAAVAGHMARGNEGAGYFRLVLDSPDRRARRLERWVAWRCRVLALPYGDQGLLVRRGLLDALGGVAPIPLMEDVDLVRRLKRHRLVALPADAVTSAARWERDGYLRRSGRNLCCLLLWFAGVPPHVVRRLYG